MVKKNFSELSVDSPIENFVVVKNWLQNIFDDISCIDKAKKQLFIVVDEIFTNIAQYAYEDKGKVKLKASYNSDEKTLELTTIDNGEKYNPLERPDPDFAQRKKDKTIGGLGIYMVKKMVDTIEYSRVDNQNILFFTKKVN